MSATQESITQEMTNIEEIKTEIINDFKLA